MLHFYAVEDLQPWPDDIPTASRLIGSMGLREFHSCNALLQACLRRCGVEASYFEDWIVPRKEVGALVRCLRETVQRLPDPMNPQGSLETIISIISQAEGSILLAVCD